MTPASFSATYLPLLAAIVLETIGTSFLQASQQFTRPLPTAAMAISYVVSFYLLSLALRGLPVGVAYAVWSGLGIVLISAVGVVVFKQRLDLPVIVGLGLIVAGVVIVNAFSKSETH